MIYIYIFTVIGLFVLGYRVLNITKDKNSFGIFASFIFIPVLNTFVLLFIVFNLLKIKK